MTLAWYHGHRGLKQVGAGELMMISVLVLIGAVFFTCLALARSTQQTRPSSRLISS